MSGFALAVHAGAGNLRPGEPGEEEVRRVVRAGLEEGRRQLAAGRSALDTVERAVRTFESHELLNAGRGSVLTSTGEVEMDAAVMDGSIRAAGAVACVRSLAHPVSAARLVMERSVHVLLVGEEAEAFAREAGAETVDPATLVTDERRRQLEKARSRDRVSLDHDGGGTVGAVAQDAAGHLAAATSTGGLTNQLPGRVGDSPIIGAGTWADDATCAVSATGHGETFIRVALAHEVDAGIRLGGLTLAEACARALERATALGGRGGLVAVDAAGHLAQPFTTPGMIRGWLDARGEPQVRIFADS